MDSDKEVDGQNEQDRLGQLVAELAEVHGPVTEDELAAARAEWLPLNPESGPPS